MLKKYVLLITLLSGITIGVHAAPTQPDQKNNEIAANVIKIKTPEVNMTAKNEDATQVFMELDNNGQKTHQLIAAYSPAAQVIQIHQTIRKNAEQYMTQVPNIIIPAHHEKDLESGGFHVMLIGLNKPLKEGKKVPVVLIFEDGSYINLEVPVI